MSEAGERSKGGLEGGEALRFEGVTVVRGGMGGRVLLEGVSFAVPGGETCAVVGANGSGKTTLLRVVEGYEFPTEGVVRVLGEELGRVELGELRKRVRLVGSAGVSEPGWAREFGAEMTLAAVVATGERGALVHYGELSAGERGRAVEALEAVGLGGREEVRWMHASAGERTRTLLARAGVGGACGLLLLDEPTSGLDPAAREQTVRAMARPAAGVTQVIVTHHVEELPAVTSLALVLKQGKVLAFGEAGEVLTSEVLSEAFGIRMRVGRRGGRWRAEVKGGEC